MKKNSNNKIAASIFLLASSVVSCQMNRQGMDNKRLPNELLCETTQYIKRGSLIEEFWRANSVTKYFSKEKLYKRYKNLFNILDTLDFEHAYFLITVNNPILKAAAVKAFKENRTITTINLSKFNEYFSLVRHSTTLSWKTLAEVLKEDNTIRTINLDETINLNGNTTIRDAGVAALAEALKVNNSITTINLAGNAIGDSGVAALAEALKVNNSITTINLASNAIGNAGVAALAEALKVNRTITSIELTGNAI
ncbi:MAG: hypothetical protein NQ127_03785, partial [Candidatus Cardinium sp.]|nr:hypothetical protein [Candidatus Cardinium sp.]